MRKMSKVFLMCGILAVLTACGQAEPAGNLAQNISMGSGANQGDSGKNGSTETGTEQEPEESAQGSKKEDEGVFGFLYDGVTLIPGEVFDSSLLKEYTQVSEVPSCAFEENDREYNYGDFALTAYIDGETERVYSIYFMDPNLPTTEGLCLGDDVERMKSLYGEDCETEGNSYVYTRGDTLLSFIVQNDIVTVIEYRLNR